MDTYRAAYWQSANGQSEMVLTAPEHAHLDDEALIAEARAELVRSGGTVDGGRIIVGGWTE